MNTQSTEILASQQNPDGGWPYGRGVSWTEPTVYCVMAMLAHGNTQAAGRGVEWLLGLQRPDGGWPPQAGVDQSTWVTALVALLPPQSVGAAAHRRAVEWLLETRGRESETMHRVLMWMRGEAAPADQKWPGWPWFPGNAAWVGPTSLAILALEKAGGRRPAGKIRERVEAGRGFMLARICRGGGWNHGAARSLGADLNPYPETTGMGLAAMRGVDTPDLRATIGIARKYVAECRSADAFNWLRIGLLGQGQLPGSIPAPPPCRTVLDTALDSVVRAGDRGLQFFWNA